MPIGAFRINSIAKRFTVAAAAEVIRGKKGITALGNAQVDTAQSKFGGSSALFDGVDDYLSIRDEDLNLDWNQDFTVELWFRRNVAADGFDQLFGQWGPTETNRSLFLGLSGLTPVVYYTYGTSSIGNFSSNTNITNDTWNHLALVGNSSGLYLYLNGTQVGTGSRLTLVNSTQPVTIGANYSSADDFHGHIDELRVSNTARYTANFTPSTTPFVNDENTLLLLHMDGTDASTVFEDDNGVRTQGAIQIVNGPKISTAQSKFGGSSIYFPEQSGQAAFFWFNSIGAGYTSGGDFTVEAWVYFTKQPGQGDAGYMMLYSASPEPYILFNANTVSLGAGGYPSFTRAGSTNWAINTWYHIALVRQSGSLKCYENGTQIGNTVTSSTYNYIPHSSFTNLRMGKFGDDRGRWQGYIDEFRMSSIARYTANFTAPTAPFVNDSKTICLYHFNGTNNSTYVEEDNGASTPGRIQKHISYYGNAQISTAQSKFGGSSAYFDGQFDGLLTESVPINGIEDLTMEFWMRPTVDNTDRYVITTRALGNVLQAGEFQFYILNTSKIYFGLGFSQLSLVPTNGVVNLNTWYHIALTKSGNNFKLYVDGVLEASGTSSQAFTNTRIMLGQTYDGANEFAAYYGWLDEFRISNTVRYTSNFTPQTTAFEDDANTLLLLHFDGANASTVFTDDIGGRAKTGIISNFDTQIDTAQSKFGGSSALFDGSSDVLTVVPSNMVFGTTGEFTYECWVRPTSVSGTPTIFGTYISAYIRDGFPGFFSGGLRTGNISISTNTWSHLAWTRKDGNIKVWVNGQLALTQANSTNFAGALFYIGGDPASNYSGHMDEIRISNIARYDAAFTPATTPFQNDANTVLLIHADGTDASTVFTDDNGVPPDYDYGA